METDTKNFIIFVLLSFLVIAGWSLFMAPKPKKPPAGPAAEQVQAPAPSGETPQPVAGRTVTEAAVSAATTPTPAGETLPEAAAPAKTVLVVNGVFAVEFSTRGAVPTSWKLLKYQDRLYYPYEINIAWPPFKKIEPFLAEMVNLVNPALPPGLEPFRTEIQIAGLRVPEHADWETDVEQVALDETSGPRAVVFRLRTPQGLVLTKTYTFRPDDYMVDLELAVTPGLEARLAEHTQVVTRLSFLYETGRLTSINFHGPLCHTGENGKLYQIKVDDLVKKGPAEQAEPAWAGFSDNYFLTAMLTEPARSQVWKARYSGPEDLRQNKKASKELTGELVTVPGAERFTEGELLKLKLFMGPKQEEILERAGRKLRTAIDYGMFGILVQPLMWGLNHLYRAIPNYGVCIILLTVALRMAMFPITRKGQESMKEMQKLQPEMKKIQEKYKDDRMKQQEEMAALYKRHKINPLGGCLPMLLQIPVFFAFYKALLISIELRHAPFFGWILDLSNRDPLLIWPLVMGGTQILMQKMTPTTSADPMQQKMMMLMPVVFIFLLLYFPSGLIIYWTCSNLVGIGQQIYVNRKTA